MECQARVVEGFVVVEVVGGWDRTWSSEYTIAECSFICIAGMTASGRAHAGAMSRPVEVWIP